MPARRKCGRRQTPVQTPRLQPSSLHALPRIVAETTTLTGRAPHGVAVRARAVAVNARGGECLAWARGGARNGAIQLRVALAWAVLCSVNSACKDQSRGNVSGCDGLSSMEHPEGRHAKASRAAGYAAQCAPSVKHVTVSMLHPASEGSASCCWQSAMLVSLPVVHSSDASHSGTGLSSV